MTAQNLPGFSRQEVMRLTGLPEYRLTYLQAKNVIVPEKVKPEGYVKAFPRYSWNQILEIKAIEDLRSKDVSLQKVRILMDFLKKNCDDPRLHNNDLALIDSRIFWIKNKGDLEEYLIECLGKHQGQVTIAEVILIKNPTEELIKTAKIIDFSLFKSRIEAIMPQSA